MNRLKAKRLNSKRRSHRVRTVISLNSQKPRLSVNISNKNAFAQIIDDTKSSTLVSVSSTGKKTNGSLAEKAEFVGEELAKKAKAKKIKKLAFDRGSRMYHGNVKILAEAARKGGLEF